MIEQSPANIDFANIISRFDLLLSRGLCKGTGNKLGQMCIEQAVSLAMGLPFNDFPSCVSPSIIQFKIILNDCAWSSPEARAKGLRDLGIAQIGSKGVVKSSDFRNLIRHKIITILIPELIREFAENRQDWLDAASKCELLSFNARENIIDDTLTAIRSFFCGRNTSIVEAIDNCYHFTPVTVISSANAAQEEWNDANFDSPNKYLLLGAKIALDVLKELKSPGCDWI